MQVGVQGMSETDIMLLVADQGAVITVNGGTTWSSWYNQPTAAFYHLAADYAFPYRLCGGQQDSGSGCVSSRGNDGTIGYREFHPVGASEYSYVAPDPLNPDVYYGGTVVRFDRRTGQTQTVSPNVGRGGGAGQPDVYRGIRTMPVLFSPINPHKLYYGTNVVWQTVTGGQQWKQISPDLSRATWDVPKSVGRYTGTPSAAMTRRGVVYTIAPSPVDSNTIWAGTDDGQIQVTRNGGRSWRNVTPPAIGPWAKISIMDASHNDAGTAYAAVNTIRLDDLRPHIYRTRDGGNTWSEIVSGIADGAPINAVKEDPKRRGLLFAGSETQVWFSLDDGDHWHALRLNMPATSIRDLVIKDNDLAVATHGRGFWILDDISALRQWGSIASTDAITLFKPGLATRVRYSMYTDTPVPPDEPYAENPPDGAIIDYYVQSDLSGPLTLDILDGAGRVLRSYSSTDKAEPVKDVGNFPAYWFRPPQVLSTKAGWQRFTWDLHLTPPGENCSLPISATPHNTKCEPEGPWVHPGTYIAKLTANGVSHTQSFVVRMDPRVTASAAALRQQYTLSVSLYDAALSSPAMATRARALRTQLLERKRNATGELARTIDALVARLEQLAGPEPTAGGRGGGRGGGGRGGSGPVALESFTSIANEFLPVMEVLQGADEPPTSQAVAAARARLQSLSALQAKWAVIANVDVPALNTKLKAAGSEPLKVAVLRRRKLNNEIIDDEDRVVAGPPTHER